MGIKDVYGLVSRFVLRKTRRWNIDNRTERIINKEKPAVAPKYKATLKEINMLKKEYPGMESEIHKKNEALHQNLGKVFVKSDGDNPDVNKVREMNLQDKPLPQSRDPSTGEVAYTTITVPPGSYTITQVLEFIAEYGKNPEENTHLVLAEKYSIDPHVMQQLVTYVKIFGASKPDPLKDKYAPSRFAEYMKGMSPMYKDPYETLKLRREYSGRLPTNEEFERDTRKKVKDFIAAEKIEEPDEKVVVESPEKFYSEESLKNKKKIYGRLAENEKLYVKGDIKEEIDLDSLGEGPARNKDEKIYKYEKVRTSEK